MLAELINLTRAIVLSEKVENSYPWVIKTVYTVYG